MGNNNLHVKDFCTYPFHILVSCSNIFTQCCNIAESRRKKCSFLYFALFLQVLVSCTFVTGHNLFDGVTVTKSDYHALRALKHELIDFKGVLRSWNESGFGACSGSWVGIKCVNGNVIAIQLPFKGLGGKISEKIGQLQSLRKISLHDNLLTGPIPYSLGFLPNLRGLYLFNNKLSGSIPPSIGNCLMLQSLDVSNNLLIGKIPHSLSNFTRIYRINLSFNSLSGSIPSSITMSPSLTILALQYNNLSGSIPSYWGGMGKNKGFGSKLQVLTLDHNLISGTIPVSISKLSLVENVSLSHNKIVGSIPSELHALSRLRFLDLSNNDINGSIPKTFSNLASLVSLNLEGNKLENHIPDSLNRLHNLSVLNLKNNKLDGKIPSTIGNIKGITKIDLSKNKLFGEIPHSFAKLAKLSFFNVSYNNLSGPVPYVLTKRFHSSSFTGNLKLCGFIASKPCPSPSPQILPSPTQNPSSKQHHHHKLSTKSILLIAAGIIIIILLVTCCLLLCCLVKKRGDSKGNNGKAKAAASATIIEKGGGGVGGIESSGGEAGGKLVHFDGPFVFTADDLLCATAEIMGKSPYGTAYKATLEDGNQVVVKRLREKSTKGQKEFETEAASLGKIRHQNLLALRAYYLGPKGEKLLVFDYMTKGSLASFLHARGPETVIEWPTRMNIAIGITHGLYHLHKEENIVHGNLTSSNILLDEQTNPHITDFGLSRLMTTSASTNIIATAGNLGYNPPELSKTKKPNQKSDVYSLGVIILELLTGKPPGETSNGMELPQWVASIVKEEWTNEVFDLELMRDATTITDELLNTLKLALHCVDPSPSARPDIQQVLHQLNQIKPQLLAAHDDE